MEHTGTTRRTQAERDAITVEIGYALCSAAFLGALAFGVVAGPALLFELPHAVRRTLVVSGLCVASVLFVVRAVSVLVRFGHEAGAGSRSRSGSGGQPSQPGRTNPDS
ncbi:DUF6332 family protein [Streptomyces avermitilis]|uniref:DUF6332 family protein n=1 Tax=Streptomyces avermitilis TaxID=33903 RepID=UPI00380EC462